MIKGIVRLEFVDVETHKVNREIVQENFIFFENYRGLWTSGQSPTRPAIIGRGLDIFPMYDKNKDYFGRNQPFITGYAPTGTVAKKFFQKTDDSPAYWDFYSLFQPPAVLSSIPCIGLTTVANENAEFTSSTGDSLWTALNLDPYCYQAPTEYLNVYYRLILEEDEENSSPDFIRNQFVADIGRDSNKVIFPNVAHKTYPFRLEQDLTRNGYVNYVSSYYASLPNKTVTYPNMEHNKLYNAQKTYTYPEASPNQYTQCNFNLVNTIVRGTGNTRLTDFNTVGRDGASIGLNPIKITPVIDETFTGIGNVFSASKVSALSVFDPANFPIGTGRMRVAGQLSNLNKDPFPTTIQCEITNAGQSMFDDARYRAYTYRLLGAHNATGAIPLPLLPTVDSGDHTEQVYQNHKTMMYKNANSVHVTRANVVKYLEDRSFITWDKTGITIYDIYHGTLDVFDENGLPSLAVTNINDVKVDSRLNIWVSCADTGLWKLTFIDETQVQLTHIGLLPGSQQKCYAIDVDNHGTVYAIFWGAGLFYTTDFGVSWVNVPIDYSPFSGYESSGFVSRWSYVARMICNQERKASDGVGQLLLLMKSDSPQFTTTAGCWYDFQSQLTTGITNASMKNQLSSVRDLRASENVKVSNLHNTWFFLQGGGSLYWSDFQGNDSMIGITNGSQSGGINAFNMEMYWDNTDGVLKEQITLGLACSPRGSVGVEPNVMVIDVQTRSLVKTILPAADTLFGNFSASSTYIASGIKLGKNIFVSCSGRWYYGAGYGPMGFALVSQLGYSKENRQWCADSWGWNGGQWTKNHMANKPIHGENSELFRGAACKFTDGHPATVSWSVGDTFTFTVFDGFFKDNSSTMALRDTVYYKPTDVCEVFEPPIVSVINKSDDIGVLFTQPIELEWDINDLPDTTYSGGSVVSNGDKYFNNVALLQLFNDENGLTPTVGTVNETIGLPEMDVSFKILNEQSIKLDGLSGFTYESSVGFSLGNRFTVEGMFAVAETGKKMHLFDFRNATNTTFACVITEIGKLAFEVNGVIYGNIGDFVFPGDINYLAWVRTENTLSAYINHVKQFDVNLVMTMPASTGLHLFKRFTPTLNGWEGFRGWASNVRISRNMVRPSLAKPTGFYPTFGNTYSGAGLVLKGNYSNGSIISKKELVGDWEVLFRDVTTNMMEYDRERPFFAFGVSIQHFVESVTDISYRVCGEKIGSFLQTHSQERNMAPEVNLVKIEKNSNVIWLSTSIDNGLTWFRWLNIADNNPVHYICFWQVQGNINDIVTPSVEIVRNGSAIFSKVGAPQMGNGKFRKKFLAMDVNQPSDIDISLQGTPVTKARSNWLDPALPLEGEVFALQSGVLMFHENDVGKQITGRMITIRD